MDCALWRLPGCRLTLCLRPSTGFVEFELPVSTAPCSPGPDRRAEFFQAIRRQRPPTAAAGSVWISEFGELGLHQARCPYSTCNEFVSLSSSTAVVLLRMQLCFAPLGVCAPQTLGPFDGVGESIKSQPRLLLQFLFPQPELTLLKPTSSLHTFQATALTCYTVY